LIVVGCPATPPQATQGVMPRAMFVNGMSKGVQLKTFWIAEKTHPSVIEEMYHTSGAMHRSDN